MKVECLRWSCKIVYKQGSKYCNFCFAISSVYGSNIVLYCIVLYLASIAEVYTVVAYCFFFFFFLLLLLLFFVVFLQKLTILRFWNVFFRLKKKCLHCRFR